MGKVLKSGSRVRFVDDERLDMPDALAFSELVYDTLNEVSAGAFGVNKHPTRGKFPPSGTLSALKFDVTDLENVVISSWNGGPAIFVHNYMAVTDGGYLDTQVLVYDPTMTGQQTTVDISAYSPSDAPVIWAKRIDFNDASASRRKWVSGVETPFSMETRETYRVSFAVTASNSPPSTDVGWFAIAQSTQQSGTFKDFDMIHPLDRGISPLDDAEGINDTPATQRFFGPWISQQISTLSPRVMFLGAAHAMTLLKDLTYAVSDVADAASALAEANETAIEDLTTDLALVSATMVDKTNHAPAAWCILWPDGEGGWTLPTQKRASGFAEISITGSTSWSVTVGTATPFTVYTVQVQAGGTSGKDYIAEAYRTTLTSLTINLTTLGQMISTGSYSDLTSISPEFPTEFVYVFVFFYKELA